MLGSLYKSDNEFDDVKLNIKCGGQREAKTMGDVCDITRRYSVCNIKIREAFEEGAKAHVVWNQCTRAPHLLPCASESVPSIPVVSSTVSQSFGNCLHLQTGLLCLEGRCDADAGADLSHHARHSPAPCRSVANGSSSRQRLWGLWGEMIETRCLPLRVVSPKHVR